MQVPSMFHGQPVKLVVWLKRLVGMLLLSAGIGTFSAVGNVLALDGTFGKSFQDAAHQVWSICSLR
jgi:hypothetical protein